MNKKEAKILNKKLADNKKYHLSFTPDDIKYIIVNKENEILPLIHKIRSIKGGKFTQNQIDILITRIITMDSIRETF